MSGSSQEWQSALLCRLEIFGTIWDKADLNFFFFSCFLNISHPDRPGESRKLRARGCGMLQVLSPAQKGVKQVFLGVRKLIWNKISSKPWAQLCTQHSVTYILSP